MIQNKQVSFHTTLKKSRVTGIRSVGSFLFFTGGMNNSAYWFTHPIYPFILNSSFSHVAQFPGKYHFIPPYLLMLAENQLFNFRVNHYKIDSVLTIAIYQEPECDWYNLPCLVQPFLCVWLYLWNGDSSDCGHSFCTSLLLALYTTHGSM